MTWKSSVLASFNLDFKTILVDIEKNGSDFDLNKLKKNYKKDKSNNSCTSLWQSS